MTRNRWIALFATLVLVSGGAWYYFTQFAGNQSQAESEEPPLQTSAVRRGNIIISATGAGTVIPAEEVELAFGASGTLTQLNVQAGDLVEAGNVLAVLDDADQRKSIQDAELAVLQAELSLQPETLERNVALAEISVRQAELNLGAANEVLVELTSWEPDDRPSELLQAELNLVTAQTNYSKMLAAGETTALDLQLSALNIQSAQANLDEVKNNADNPWLEVSQAQLNVSDAEANLAAMRGEINNPWLEVEQAELNLQTAQNNLNRLLQQGANSTSASVAGAEYALLQAQQQLDDLLNWQPDWGEIKTLQAQYQAAVESLNDVLAQAELVDQTLADERIALEQAERDLANAEAEYANAYDSARDWERNIEDTRERAAAQLQTAQDNLERAQAAYDIAVANSSFNSQIANAQASVANAEANLKAAQEPPSDEEIALAREDVRQKQLALNEARDNAGDTTTSYNTDVANARASVGQAEIALQQAKAGATNSNNSQNVSVQMAVSQLENARLKLQQAQQSSTNAATGQTANVKGSGISLQQAQIQYEIAKLDAGLIDSNQSLDLLSAELSVQQAALALQEVIESLDEEADSIDGQIADAKRDVELAELSLQQAQINLADTQDTTQAEISLQQAELNLESAERNSGDAVLTAPAAGTVLAVNANVGETVSGAIVTIANLDETIIEIFLDESDIGQVRPGNPVDVTFDAMPEETFGATITRVDPLISVSNNVSAVRALATLDQNMFGISNAPISVGMNANIEVIGAQATDALIVPIESLREIGEGQFAVFVMEDGEPRLRMVEVGIRDFSFVEILSGVEVGEIVTTGIVETQ